MTHLITKFWIGYIVAALGALLLIGAVASAQTLPPGNDDIILSGFLNCARTNAERTCPFRLHYVQFTKGRIYCLQDRKSVV